MNHQIYMTDEGASLVDEDGEMDIKLRGAPTTCFEVWESLKAHWDSPYFTTHLSEALEGRDDVKVVASRLPMVFAADRIFADDYHCYASA